MSRRKKKTRRVKSRYSKCKTKKAANKKHKPKTPSFLRKNKKSNNDDNTNQNEKNDDDTTVKRSKLICRRYEEFHENFLNYDKILKFLQKTQRCNPGSMDLVKIGNSTQGKPIYMVLITTSFSSSASPKMATFIHAGMNGENVIAVSNTLYMIEYLTKNPNYVKIMDYYIVPCCNPDAYDEFIKNKEKDSKKSETYCSLEKKKSHRDISQSDKKDKRKRSDSPKSDKRGSKKSRCDGPSENKTNAQSFRTESPESDAESPKKSCSNSSANKNKKDGGGKTFQKNKTSKGSKKSSNSSNKPSKAYSPAGGAQNGKSTSVDLTLNFPVVLGLSDMKRIPTHSFLEKIKLWKENYVNHSPETKALINAIYNYQFAIKLLISMHEDGEAICYPYGFCAGTNVETNDLKEVAKKGKFAISGRNFEYGSLYDIQGLTYGNLMDFLKVDKSSIKYMYVIKVYKKTPRYNEKDELRQIMRYGCEIMECVKRMSCAVYKFFTDMTGNKKVETERTKPTLEKRSSFE